MYGNPAVMISYNTSYKANGFEVVCNE